MSLDPGRPPAQVAFRHCGARTGFEVAFPRVTPTGLRIDGHTTAVEEGAAWAVQYTIEVDVEWAARRALVSGRTAAGPREVVAESDGRGHWRVNGVAAPHLDGCFDVDLESSALTNTFPVHRLALGIGHAAEAPAAYVRATDLAVERLEQRYERVADEEGRQCFEYTAPAFGFACRLVYDRHGVVLDYPGIAVRVA